MGKRVLIIIEKNFLATALSLTRQEFSYTEEQAVDAWKALYSKDVLTNYWLSSHFSDNAFAKLQNLAANFPNVFVREYDFENDAAFPQVKIEELGLTTSLSGQQ